MTSCATGTRRWQVPRDEAMSHCDADREDTTIIMKSRRRSGEKDSEPIGDKTARQIKCDNGR